MNGGYKAPRCECGHLSGDHAWTRPPAGSAAPKGGSCYVPGCDCKSFREVEEPKP